MSKVATSGLGSDYCPPYLPYFELSLILFFRTCTLERPEYATFCPDIELNRNKSFFLSGFLLHTVHNWMNRKLSILHADVFRTIPQCSKVFKRRKSSLDSVFRVLVTLTPYFSQAFQSLHPFAFATRRVVSIAQGFLVNIHAAPSSGSW